MKYRIEIDMSNAAFEDEGAEVARLLRDLADKADERGVAPSPERLTDLNGNPVGFTERHA